MTELKNKSFIMYETTFDICDSMPQGEKVLIAIYRKLFKDIDPTDLEPEQKLIFDEHVRKVKIAKEQYLKKRGGI